MRGSDIAEMVAKSAPLDLEKDLRIEGNRCTLLFTCSDHAEDFLRALICLIASYKDVDDTWPPGTTGLRRGI